MTLKVSESYENNNNILYVRENLSDYFFNESGGRIIADKHRINIDFSIKDDFYFSAKEELIDKIADVIAVGYKYRFFNQRVKTAGLTRIQRELLLTALISADLCEDKRYIKSKLSSNFSFAIDGLFNFRLNNLKKKWEEIVNYVPLYFSDCELREFITYLIAEKKGVVVTVDGERVYDKRYNRMKRTNLLPDCSALSVVKEVLLSQAGEIIIKNQPPLSDKEYLIEYFSDKILFKSSENL